MALISFMFSSVRKSIPVSINKSHASFGICMICYVLGIVSVMNVTKRIKVFKKYSFLINFSAKLRN